MHYSMPPSIGGQLDVTYCQKRTYVIMMKFFRKYNKYLLAVFMVLLMIVFVAGDALNRLAAPSGNRTVAESRLGPITYADQAAVSSSTNILDFMGLDWQRPVVFSPKTLELIDWILVTREAAKLGLRPSEEALKVSIGELGGDAQLDSMARRLRVKPSSIAQAIADYLSVQELSRYVGAASAPNEAEIRVVARNTLDKLRLEAAILPAKAFLDEEFTPSEDEIAAHFKQYREKEPGQGMDFGYRIAPTAKVQFIQINRDKVAEQVRVPNLERKAHTYYSKNRKTDLRFRKSPEELEAAAADIKKSADDVVDATADADSDKKSGDDTAGDSGEEQSEEQAEVAVVEPSPYKDWEQAKEIAIEEIRKQTANEKVARLTDWVLDTLTEPWLDIERGDDGYKPTPEAVGKIAYYDEATSAIPTVLAYPGSVVTGTTSFFTQAKAFEVPLIGSAVYRPPSGLPEYLGKLAFRAKAFVPSVSREDGQNPEQYLSEFETCRQPLTGENGNVYIIRVVATRDAHAPDTIDEVRDQVVEDLRLKRAFEEANTRAVALKAARGGFTLEDAYENDEILKALRESGALSAGTYSQPEPFARLREGEAARGRGSDRIFVSPELGFIPVDIVEKCFELGKADDKTVIFELPDRPAVLVIRWIETVPAREDDFAKVRIRLTEEMTAVRIQQAITEWLDPDKIRARSGFALVGQDDGA